MSLSSHQKCTVPGKSDEYLTPPEILERLGPFDLVPCAAWPHAENPRHYTKDDDGLSLPWFGRVWCNPPFGKEAIKWARRMADHGEGVMLLPARTETKMFYETVWGRAHAVLFLRGRPHFYTRDMARYKANSGAPIALIAYGTRNAHVLCISGLGHVVPGGAEQQYYFDTLFPGFSTGEAPCTDLKQSSV